MVVPTRIYEADLSIVSMDFCMMNIGGRERTEEGFAKILKQAGLELVKVWKGFGSDRLVEARLLAN